MNDTTFNCQLSIQVDNEDVKNSALAVVEMMNERLSKNGVDKKCAKLELKRVTSALLITSKGDEDDEDINAGRSYTMTKVLKGKSTSLTAIPLLVS